MKLSQQLSGTATFTDANGVTSAASFTQKENSVPLPLPVIGFRAAWAFAPQWVLEGQGQIFKADIDGYDGRITDVRAGVTWMFSQNFGAGVGYNRFVTTVETSKERFDGRVRLGYSGVQLVHDRRVLATPARAVVGPARALPEHQSGRSSRRRDQLDQIAEDRNVARTVRHRHGSTSAIALRVARCLVASDRAAPVGAACRA